MKILNFRFLSKSMTFRQDIYTNYQKSQGANDQKSLSNFVKYGRIPASSLKGCLRHGMEKMLLECGISICHPLPQNTITNKRNKEIYEKDLMLGYHPRGACAENGGACPILDLWGDLDRPGKIIVPSIFFYPSQGGGAAMKNISKVFGEVGTGRVEIERNSPRCRSDLHKTYMTTETVVYAIIDAPLTIVLKDDDELFEVLIYKTLEFLYEKNQNYFDDFF